MSEARPFHDMNVVLYNEPGNDPCILQLIINMSALRWQSQKKLTKLQNIFTTQLPACPEDYFQSWKEAERTLRVWRAALAHVENRFSKMMDGDE